MRVPVPRPPGPEDALSRDGLKVCLICLVAFEGGGDENSAMRRFTVDGAVQPVDAMCRWLTKYDSADVDKFIIEQLTELFSFRSEGRFEHCDPGL